MNATGRLGVGNTHKESGQTLELSATVLGTFPHWQLSRVFIGMTVSIVWQKKQAGCSAGPGIVVEEQPAVGPEQVGIASRDAMFRSRG